MKYHHRNPYHTFAESDWLSCNKSPLCDLVLQTTKVWGLWLLAKFCGTLEWGLRKGMFLTLAAGVEEGETGCPSKGEGAGLEDARAVH